MKIQMEIGEFDFAAMLRKFQQWEKTDAGAIACLYYYLEDYNEATGEPIEFDPVGFACEFSILCADDIIRDNKHNVIDYAYNEIGVIDDEEPSDFEAVLEAIHSEGFDDEDIVKALFNGYIDEAVFEYEGYYLFCY